MYDGMADGKLAGQLVDNTLFFTLKLLLNEVPISLFCVSINWWWICHNNLSNVKLSVCNN